MSTFIPCAKGDNAFRDVEVKEWGDLIMVDTVVYTREDARALANALLKMAGPSQNRTRPMNAVHVCPSCKSAVGRYDFLTKDGVLVTAFRCDECERDVVPVFSEVVNHHPV